MAKSFRKTAKNVMPIAVFSTIFATVGIIVLVVVLILLDEGVLGSSSTGGMTSGRVSARAAGSDIYPEGKTLHTLFDDVTPYADPTGSLGGWNFSQNPTDPLGGTPRLGRPSTSDDDGELHDSWNSDVAYDCDPSSYKYADTEWISAYDDTVKFDFDVKYPQLTGDLASLDQINQALRDTSMLFVDETRDNPSEYSIRVAKALRDRGTQPSFSNTVDYAVSYNSDKLVSVCFTDDYMQGSWAQEYVEFHGVTANLATGQVYKLSDVLTLNDDIAASFVDNLVQQDGDDDNHDGTISDDECLAVKIAGRDAFEQAIKGGDLESGSVFTNFFVDGNGKVNIAVTYWLHSDEGVSRGWWDYTLTDEQVQAAKTDSDFWDLLA